jgi:hypothetical protein
MKFVDKVAEKDEADFNFFFEGRNDPKLVIGVSMFDQNCGHSSICQQMVSAIASFYKNWVQNQVKATLTNFALVHIQIIKI